MKEASIKKLLGWGVAVILAWAFILSGWRKLFPNEEVTSQFVAWGYDANLATYIGISEIVGAVLAIIPKTASLGAFILLVIMAGAIYTHVSTNIGSPMYAIILFVLALLLLIWRWSDFFLVKSSD